MPLINFLNGNSYMKTIEINMAMNMSWMRIRHFFHESVSGSAGNFFYPDPT